MSTLVTVLHVIVCLFLMLTVLLQSGKGGGMGAAFGGGNAATVFGGSGASSFLKRLTAIAGTVFMVTSMVLAFIASHDSSDALEKFGAEQAALAEQKEEAKEKALLEGGGSAGSAVAPDGVDVMAPFDPNAGSADPGAAAPEGSEAPASEPPAGSAAPATEPKTETKAAAPKATPPAPKAPVPAEAKPAEPTAPPAEPAPNAPTP